MAKTIRFAGVNFQTANGLGATNSVGNNLATVGYTWVGGGLNEAGGNHSIVSGGHTNFALWFWPSVGGGQANTAEPANQSFVTVSGGMGCSTLNSHDWVGDGLLEDDQSGPRGVEGMQGGGTHGLGGRGFRSSRGRRYLPEGS